MARKTAAHNAMFSSFHQARGAASPLGGQHNAGEGRKPPPAPPPAELDPGITSQQQEAISFAGSQGAYAETNRMAQEAGLPGPIVIQERRPVPEDEDEDQ